MKIIKKWMYHILFVLCALVFVGSAGVLADQLVKYHLQERTFHDLRALFPEQPQPSPFVEPRLDMDTAEIWDERNEARKIIYAQAWKDWWEEEAGNRFLSYQLLAAENPDIVGWIRIEGTAIDYPVCQTPNDPEFYLHRDIRKRKSSYGTPFLEGICRLDDLKSNLLIYGHHMKNGSMFAALEDYTNQEYFLKHPYIQFDTLYQAGSYEVAAVVKLDAAGEEVPWQGLLFPLDRKEFKMSWESVRQYICYDTGVSISFGD